MEVLLAGNTGYVTDNFIEESFPECDVVVLGNKNVVSDRAGEHCIVVKIF